MDGYGNSSINSLKGAMQVRDKPANMFGSDDIYGAFHSVVEIIANSLDEVRAISNLEAYSSADNTAYFKQLYVEYTKDKVIKIRDNGRGMPLAFNNNPKELKFNWHLICSQLFAGGKYEDELDAEDSGDGKTKQSNYSRSLGTNGLGCTATQYTSEYFDVKAWRDNNEYSAGFFKGMPLAHYYTSDNQHVRVILNMDEEWLYYEGAEVKALNDNNEVITITLEKFNPYKSEQYSADVQSAEVLNLMDFEEEMVKVLDSKGYPVMETVNGVEEQMVRVSLYKELYHSVLTVKPHDKPEETGTYIEWRIDNEVFHDTSFTLDMFRNLLEIQANVNGTTIHFDDEYHNINEVYEGKTTQEYFLSLIGNDIVQSVLTETAIDRGIEDGKKYAAEGEFSIVFTKEHSDKRLYLHNTSLITEEVHVISTQRALTAFFKKVGKSYNLDFKEHEYMPFISIKAETYSNVNATSFKNQTKKGVTNKYIARMIEETITKMLEDAQLRRNPALMDIISHAVEQAKQRSALAEVKKNTSAVNKALKKRTLGDKYAECSSTKVEEKELHIVEGLSAMNSAVNARHGDYQSILAAQGKMPNALKRSLELLLQNEIIQDIIQVVGVGVDAGNTSSAVYNYKKLRYGKIIIMTDADKDGSQIRVLLFLVFYVLMPDLLRKGHVYLLETPIISIETNEGLKWAYTLEERDAILKDLRARGVAPGKQKRYKGLGSFTAELLKQTAMNPETRRLVPLTIDRSNNDISSVIDTLFGKDENRMRKEIILEAVGAGIQKDLVEDLIAETTYDDGLDGAQAELNSIQENEA